MSISPTPSGAANAISSSAPSLVAPGLWRRMACWLYEGVLLFAVIFIASWLFSTLSQMRNGMDPRLHHLLQAFLFIVLGVYFIWFWIHGQTLAMKTWRIRVVTAQGRPRTPRPALRRYQLSGVWLLPPLAALSPFGLSGGEMAVLTSGWVIVWALLARFQPERQFWHDIWAGTRLIASKPLSR
jgi:uncharacterized RDD family membrane protein YckC